MSRLKLTISLLSFLASLLILPTQSQAVDKVLVTLKLDRNKATLMDTVRMVIKVSGTGKVSSRPEIQGLDNFDVGQGGTSSRVEIVNGKVNSGIDYSYTLQPRKTGTFQIGPAIVKVKGKTYKSNVETLTITEQIRSSGESRGALFLSAGLSKKKAYVEEQNIYTLKLYRQVSVSDISLRLPEADHLTFKQLGQPYEYQETYNDEPYQVLEVRYVLISTKVGTFGIRPARMNLIVLQTQRRSRFGIFDDPFFSRSGEQRSVASEPLELTVLALPEQGRPEGFSGLLGTFEIDSRLEPKEIKAGESSTFTLTISGRGNVNRIPDLKMPELDKINIYSDEPVLEEGLDSKGIKGSKTMKWALVPEKEGQYIIPQISAVFFDTDKDQYLTLKSRPLSLKVLPGEEEKLAVYQGPEKDQKPDSARKKEVTELGRDILPVHGSIKHISKGTGIGIGSPISWFVLMFPLVIFFATLVGIKLSKRSLGNLTITKARKAGKNLIRQSCKKGITSNELIQAFQEYLNNRFNLAMGSLTANEATNVLTQNNVSLKTADKIGKLIQDLENNIYTGRGNEPYEVQQDIQGLIRTLEKEIR